MTTQGLLSIELRNQGSKSEGLYAILTEKEGQTWILHRPDVYPAGDEFFAPFNGHQVNVDGEQEIDKYICVENITIIEETKEEPENEQNDMP